MGIQMYEAIGDSLIQITVFSCLLLLDCTEAMGNICLDHWASVSTLFGVLMVMNVAEHILIGEGCLMVQHGKVTHSLCLEARKIL